MAKIGYIYKANHYDSFEADKEWMLKFGCVQVIEEGTDHEVMRPQWKQLMYTLDRGDVLVVSKFSNAVRGVRELSACLEMCRIKVVRLISIQDRIDTKNELFKDTTAADVLAMVGSLPEEAAALRRSSLHVMQFQQNIKKPAKTTKSLSRAEREKTIVDMYNKVVREDIDVREDYRHNLVRFRYICKNIGDAFYKNMLTNMVDDMSKAVKKN